MCKPSATSYIFALIMIPNIIIVIVNNNRVISILLVS